MSALMEITIGDLLEKQAGLYPDQDCLVSPYLDVRYSYKEFNELTDLVARAFMGMGIGKGRQGLNLGQQLSRVDDYAVRYRQDGGGNGYSQYELQTV